MFSEEQKEIVRKINASPYKLIFTATGGGTSFIGDFLSISGGSNTVLGAFIPYSAQITEDIISLYDHPKAANSEKIKLVSKDCAECLCVYGFDILRRHSSDDDIKNHLLLGNKWDKIISISCTASLAKDNEREGRIHQAYISVLRGDDRSNPITEKWRFNSTRENEEKELSAKILDILAKECKREY